LAVLIGFSRLYLYVHYFTDVLVGALLGVLYAVAAYFIVNAVARKYPKIFSAKSDKVQSAK
jgi:undecaprenyl-diphosphatase